MSAHTKIRYTYPELPLPEHPCGADCACVPCAAYIRVSQVGKRGKDLISPELQLSANATYANANGLRIVEVVYDIDKSGREFAGRRIGEMAEAIKAGTYQYVLVYRWDRWGRTLMESLKQIDQLEKLVNGKQVVQSATEPFDTKTTIGEFSRDQMLLIGRLQSNMIGDSWRATQQRYRDMGLPHTPSPRFGYKFVKGTPEQVKNREAGYIVDESLRELIKSAYEYIISGGTFYALTHEWNAKGIPSLTGKTWIPATLTRYLDTGFAAGWIRERSVRAHAKTGGRMHMRHYDIWRKGAHEPIIDEETWEKYKEIRLNAPKLPPRLRVARHALSGLLYCGVCDEAGIEKRLVTAYSGKHKLFNWICPDGRYKRHPFLGISNARAMRQIFAWVESQVGSGDSVTAEARRIARTKSASASVERLTEELNRLVRRRKNINLRLVDAEGSDVEDLTELLKETKEKITALETELASVKAIAASGGTNLVQVFSSLAEHWDSYAPHDQREALSRLVKKFIVSRPPGSPKGTRATVVPVPRFPTE